MITTSANKKANVRQITDADILSTSGQPVVAAYEVDSVAGQTMIPNTGSLPFLINTANRENFELFVDGKLLRYGANNDYTFADVDSNGFSSRIQLNSSLYGTFNIIAIKRGLKKEQELGVDQRFSDIYSAASAALQPFVDESSLLTATTSTSPSSSQFHSTVINRASIPNINNDLKCRMGVERVMVQQIYQVQNEFGPNGEPVWAVLNDDRGLVRFVGGWSNLNNSWGTRVISSGTNNVDYIEITAYCTGLNLLIASDSASKTVSAYMDGNLLTSNFMPTGSPSGVLGAKNYSPNCVVNVTSKQTLGLHTFKLLVTGSNPDIYGFEILNEASTINVRPGTAYSQLKPIFVSEVSTIDYSSSFNAITKDGVSAASLGARGGHVVVYLDTDGTIKKKVTATNSTAAYLTSADHAYEEIIRRYSFREFGAGKASDDFSSLSISASSRAFTLDDGTTTLAGQNVRIIGSGYDTLMPLTTNDFITFTFVGTGLDVELLNGSGANLFTYTPSIDGVALSNITQSTVSLATAGSKKVVKIVSGLHYGTHTFKYLRADNNDSVGINSFIVYGPKKPSISSNIVELADYYIMADYNSSTVTGTALTDWMQVPYGVLGKAPAREFTYVGANWSISGIDTTNINFPLGPPTTTGINNSQTGSYTFFGTGVLLNLSASSGGTYDFSVTIDGSLNASGVAKTNASNILSGSYRSTSTTAGAPCRVEFTGLTLGVHTVTIQRTAGTGNFSNVGFHVITPIHSPKSNLVADIQNTLPVGSCAISDNRQITSIKEAIPGEKAWAQAVGIQNASTTSTFFVPLLDMSLTIKTQGGPLNISYSTVSTNSTTSANRFQIYVDGVATGIIRQVQEATTGSWDMSASDNIIIPVSPGVHKIDLYWNVSGGTGTAAGGSAGQGNRVLNAKEL
jgi:hypothetical protein